MLSTSPTFAKKAKFDHDTTGFILSGSHQRVSCDTCHTRGIFKGTPKQCEACHSRISEMGATKKHANHIQSSDTCDDCHTEISFSDASVDHSNVTGSCVSCHNGKTATGKTKNHVKSSDSCDNCHSTRAWRPARFNHANVSAACSTCHNGDTAIGKSSAVPPHIVSSDNCEDCHTGFSTFKGANAHRGVTDNCARCHNGSVIGAKTKAQAVPTHIPSSDVCEDCHSNTKFDSFKGANVHIGVTGNCFSCHNGAIAKGKVSAVPNHIPSSNVCEDCHSNTKFDNFSGANPHKGVTDNCASCHNGSIPSAKSKAQAVPVHIPSSNVCEDCHSNTKFDSFKGADVHKNVTDNCFSCHNGSIPGATSKAQAVPTHIPSSNVCEDCHAGFSTFRGANIHIGVIDNCFSCHNGATAKGKASAVPIHIPSSNVCEDCHSNTKFDNFSGANPHKNVIGNCVSCHNGSIPSAKSKVQAVPVHIPSSNVCEDCHTGFTTFKGANPHKGVTDNCFSCHNGSITSAKSKVQAVPVHIPSSNVCEDCHTGFSTFTGANPHKNVNGNCVSCHNGSIPSAKSKVQAVPMHIPSTDVCEDCHKSFTTFTGANPHVGVTDNCVRCHNGSIPTATSKAQAVPTHISSSDVCEDCHKSFVTFAGGNPHVGVTGNCFSCHNGTSTTAIGKNQAPTLHVPSSNICEDCHKNFTSFKGAKYDHSGVTTCSQCHLTDAPLGGNHPTSTSCETCHAYNNWLNVIFVHSDVANPGTCLDCHRNDKTPGHFVTTLVCDTCHSPAGTWKSRLIFDHSSPNYPGDHGGNVNTCRDCHTGNSAAITYTNLPAYAPDCAGCHAGRYDPGPHKKYLNTKYTVNELRDCAGACHEYSDATLTTIIRSRNSEHRPNGRF